VEGKLPPPPVQTSADPIASEAMSIFSGSVAHVVPPSKGDSPKGNEPI